MTKLMFVIGVLCLLAGLFVLFRPNYLFGFLRKHMDRPSVYGLAVVVRLLLGALLVIASDQSRYPLFILVIGWVTIVAGAVLGLLGGRRFRLLLFWVLNKLENSMRFAGFLAVAFGGLIAYAFI